jgi:hypothetical protein
VQYESARRLSRQCRDGGVLLDSETELADRFESCGDAKMDLFDYIEVFSDVVTRPLTT